MSGLARCRAALVVAALLLTACAAARPEGGGEGLAPVWPPPPQAPRIVWDKELRSSVDAGVRRAWWRRLADQLLGIQEAGLVRPYGVLTDQRGRLLVADAGGGLVHLYDPAAGAYRRLTGPAERPFRSPIGLTAGPDGAVFLTDSAAATIYRLDPAGEHFFPWVASGLERPTGIVYNPVSGLLYVVDTNAHQVVAFDPHGTFEPAGREVLRFGTRGALPGQFNFPVSLAVMPDGRLVAVDALNNRLQLLSAGGEALAVIGQGGDVAGTFDKPKGVAVSREGYLFVCDALQDNVQIFDENGRFLLAFGQPGQAPGEFWMPTGIWIDGEDVIYVSDSFNQRVQLFHYLPEHP